MLDCDEGVVLGGVAVAVGAVLLGVGDGLVVEGVDEIVDVDVGGTTVETIGVVALGGKDVERPVVVLIIVGNAELVLVAVAVDCA
jgi:hypothetical protein